jgi:hypothetical protein
MKLRPLYVITGTLHVEGGDTTKVKSTPAQTTGKKEHMTVVHERTITEDRRKGNTVATHYSRKIKHMRTLKTPWGTLLQPTHINDFRELMNEVAKEVAAFNREYTTCSLVNSYVVEKLNGPRLAAIEGWLAKQIRNKRPEVLEVVDQLDAEVAA